jgi:hypothetical protein
LCKTFGGSIEIKVMEGVNDPTLFEIRRMISRKALISSDQQNVSLEQPVDQPRRER